MTFAISRRGLIAGGAALAAAPAVAAPAFAADVSPAMQAVLEYAKTQKTTGFLIVKDRKVLVEQNWAPQLDAPGFRPFVYERTADGALLEDVASQQKSFVSMLAAVAIDKGLLDVEKPVADYLGAGWSKASPEQEKAIKVIHVLTMCTGLNEQFGFVAPAGTLFFYNTPVYASTKPILAAAASQPLEVITRDWLTAPAGMTNTAWRKRPAALADAQNPTGLVTCPRDVATFGQIVLDGGKAKDGKRIVSEANLKAMFVRSKTNPAYGRLWWLNGSTEVIRAAGRATPGQLVPAAPADMVAAFGLLSRRLYVVPSQQLIVVRMGAAPDDAAGFDQQLWLRLSKALA